MTAISEREVLGALKELGNAEISMGQADMQSFQNALGDLMHALNEPAARATARGAPHPRRSARGRSSNSARRVGPRHVPLRSRRALAAARRTSLARGVAPLRARARRLRGCRRCRGRSTPRRAAARPSPGGPGSPLSCPLSFAYAVAESQATLSPWQYSSISRSAVPARESSRV
jgi:hypothetical protein